MTDLPLRPTAEEWAAAAKDGDDELDYWRAHRNELITTYPDEHVAVHAGEVVAHSPDLPILLGLVRELGLDPHEVWTRYISVGRHYPIVQALGMNVQELEAEVARLRGLLGWKVKQRLKALTNSERIALFLCSDEDTQGHSGFAVNEHGQLFSWWEHLGPLECERETLGESELTDPEFVAALAEVMIE